MEWSALERSQAKFNAATGRKQLFASFFGKLFPASADRPDDASYLRANSPYERAITYYEHGFDLEREVSGAVNFINRLLPAGKRVNVVQWSGDTLPFEGAVAAVRRAGLRNLNGGDTRFDREYQSYGWVSAIGRQVGAERQIYASNSNENTYTNLWTDRFFGFKYLIRTIDNTETPIRIKPHNIYYHMYSGEKLPSMLAVVENYRYARTKELAPVASSRYAAIADGFYSAEITQFEANQWRITNRGQLQTIRIDNSTLRSVDFERSSGVIGQRHYQGSLYIALDPDDPSPVIALHPVETSGSIPAAARPYLVHGRWELSGMQFDSETLKFRAQGFGSGELFLKMPAAGSFRTSVVETNGATWERLDRTDAEGLLRVDLGPNGIDGVAVTISPFSMGAPDR